MTRYERAAEAAVSVGAAAAPRCGRRVAVLQPYLFPYLGTFQLARQVDRFMFFDDVAFIKKGYIHRNQLLLGGKPHPFTAPVRQVSQNRTIAEHVYVGEWTELLNLVHSAYAKAPQFEAVFPLVQAVLTHPDENVARKNARSMAAVFSYLELPFDHGFASTHALPPECRAAARVQAVCRAEGAGTYVNPVGGRALYDPDDFARAGMALRFCTLRPGVRYDQQGLPAGTDFVPHLSMLDVLMHCGREEVIQLLDACDLAA